MKKKNIQFQIDVYLLFKVELGYFPIIVFIPLVKLLYGTPENHHAMSKTDAKKHRKLLTSMETRESRKVGYQSSFIRKYRCWDLVEIERFFFLVLFLLSFVGLPHFAHGIHVYSVIHLFVLYIYNFYCLLKRKYKKKLLICAKFHIYSTKFS